MLTHPIRAIIGLGNPGPKYARNRHNIGFMILDALAEELCASWQTKNNFEQATAEINGKSILLIKPQTFMNDSGKVLPFITKQGIYENALLVIHDELELPFGQIKLKVGGSAKGHNGLKSIMEAIGPDFARLRIGIARPANREDVPNYVLQNFSESSDNVQEMIDQAITQIKTLIT